MAKNDFSDIRNYAELEESIRMVRREIEGSKLSQQVSHFKAQGGPTWNDVALIVIRALKKRLDK